MYYAIINTDTRNVMAITASESKSIEIIDHCHNIMHPAARAKCGIEHFIEFNNGVNITVDFVIIEKKDENNNPTYKQYVKYNLDNQNA